MDRDALNLFLKVREEIKAKWPENAFDVIKSHNREMYDRMGKIEDVIDAMIKIHPKSKLQKKKFEEAVSAWKRIHELGIQFSYRHGCSPVAGQI